MRPRRTRRGGTDSSATAGSGGSSGAASEGGTGALDGGTGGGNEAYPAPAQTPADEDGSQLWLRFPKVNLPSRLAEYQAALTQIATAGTSATLQAAQSELVKGLSGLTGTTLPVVDQPTAAGAVVIGTPTSSTIVSALSLGSSLTAVGAEGYLVKATTISGKAAIVVAGNSDIGVLHGVFALLRHLQCHRTLAGLALL